MHKAVQVSWDRKTRIQNIKKYGFDLIDAVPLLDNLGFIVSYPHPHSKEPPMRHWITLGVINKVLVAVSWLDNGSIQLLSLRKARNAERLYYRNVASL